jgi:thiamine pyrophosphokinase
MVVGDMDSSDDADRAWAQDAGARLVRHPVDKDQTDLELALQAAVDAGVEHLVVFGVDGGRDDHVLGNWAAVCGVVDATVEVRAPAATSHVVRESIRFEDTQPGDLVSVIPWGGVALGVTTSGLKWPLDGADLSPFAALGVSNECLGGPASVSLDDGVAIVVRPISPE